MFGDGAFTKTAYICISKNTVYIDFWLCTESSFSALYRPSPLQQTERQTDTTPCCHGYICLYHSNTNMNNVPGLGKLAQMHITAQYPVFLNRKMKHTNFNIMALAHYTFSDTLSPTARGMGTHPLRKSFISSDFF